MRDALGHEHRDREAATERRAGTLLPQGRRHEKSLDLDPLDAFGRKPGSQLASQVLNEVERTMSVASGGEALEVVASNPPGRVEVGDGRCRVECAAVDVAENGRGGICLASKAGVAEGQGLEAGAAAVTAIDIAHGGAVVEGVAAGGNAEGHGDVHRPLDGSAVVATQLG